MKALNYCLFTVLVFSFTTVYAQKQVTGRIINERTDEAVPFTTVRLLNPEKGINADANGRKFYRHCWTIIYPLQYFVHFLGWDYR